jgi:hypothetical protein
MSWVFTCHVHTRRSADCMTSPAALVKHALKLGIDVLAVTDHDTWQGAVDVREAAAREKRAVRVILATEVRTHAGDLIGLFLERDVLERDPLAFCDAVHAQGGLVVLPHPYKWHRLDEVLLARVDVIETHNARCSRDENARAEALANERRMPKLVGPDAHRVGELLLARNEFDGEAPRDDDTIKQALLRAPRRFHTQSGSIWDEWLSQGVKFTRRPSPGLGWGLARGAVRRLLKPGAYRGA